MRYVAMAQIIQREPVKLSTAEITKRLHEDGYECGKRTVERDLTKLSEVFKYTSESADNRANLWFYSANSPVREFPGMQPSCALVLKMATDYLTPLLPATALELVKPYLGRAESVLQAAVGKRWSGWLARLRVVTPGVRRKAPAVEPTVQNAVYQAVLEGKQLQVDYHSLNADEPKAQILHPQGLVLRGGVIYLVATAWEYDEPYHYALHRIRKAELQDARARRLEGFDFDAYVERTFSYPISPAALRLRLRAETHVAKLLGERPLSDDQRIQPTDDRHIVTATVDDTEELRWWLLSFGPQLEVLKPLKLRKELARKTGEMAALYAREVR